ncbi:thioredoxin family protein [Dictyobacter arantiisoli]|uniref:Thioredoxin n=1 Tax=Dictyobacter arantiisoli TaxID=2014874 RepID=A0A5A5TKB1_9CHLR|nr:thioredoxin domain-containing protein [Dictyobacter arantiisoli]GCF11516.1 hypothetical protein KDI_50800 [Dictyobacter arantiisoli]
MADNYIEVTSQDFTEKVLQASELVVVLFATEQSSACKIQEPELQAISKDYSGRIIFSRLDITGQEEVTAQWKIEGIPTLLFFKGGHVIHRISGIVMRDKLRRQLDGALLAD